MNSRSNGIYAKYAQLPLWLRWGLFLPISSVGALIYIGLYRGALLSFGDAFWLRALIGIVSPVVVQSIFLVLVFYTVPKGKVAWVTGFAFLRITCGFLLIHLHRADVFQGNDWSGVVAEVLVVAGSLRIVWLVRMEIAGPNRWLQIASSRLEETRPELFEEMKKAGTLPEHLKGLAASLESLYITQNEHLLKKGLPPEQAAWEAEHLAIDTYLQAPGTEN